MSQEIVKTRACECSARYIKSLLRGNKTESAVVYGPSMCGKTLNHEYLAKKFGFSVVIDDATKRDFDNFLPRNGALILTNEEDAIPGGFKSLPFDEAMSI